MYLQCAEIEFAPLYYIKGANSTSTPCMWTIFVQHSTRTEMSLDMNQLRQVLIWINPKFLRYEAYWFEQLHYGYGPSSIFIWTTTKIVGKYEQAKSATWTMHVLRETRLSPLLAAAAYGNSMRAQQFQLIFVHWICL